MSKTPPASENLWQFNYKSGSAPKSGIVRGKDEDTAYRVAVRWCALNSVRPPAKVFPMILADEGILLIKAGPIAEATTVADTVAATTAVNVSK